MKSDNKKHKLELTALVNKTDSLDKELKLLKEEQRKVHADNVELKKRLELAEEKE